MAAIRRQVAVTASPTRPAKRHVTDNTKLSLEKAMSAEQPAGETSEASQAAPTPLLSDFAAIVDRCRLLAKMGCYCCDVWPVEDEGSCERCLALGQAAEAIAQLASMIDHTVVRHWQARRVDGKIGRAHV